MLNTSNLSELDLSTVDTHTITVREWAAVKREVVRRAHAERANVIRGLIQRFRPGWHDRSPANRPIDMDKE
jgi:hypothetical protein